MICGLQAVNAILAEAGMHPYDKADLEDIQRNVHREELEVCAEGRDAAPDPSGGNYTADALVAGACSCAKKDARVSRSLL